MNQFDLLDVEHQACSFVVCVGQRVGQLEGVRLGDRVADAAASTSARCRG